MSTREPKPPLDLSKMRRVVIEEWQLRTIEHIRSSRGYGDDVSLNSHDQTTFRLINQRKDLDQLSWAEYVVPALDEWKHWTKMGDWDSRNRLLESLTGKLRRRESTAAEVELLVVVCRPAWVRVARSLRRFGGADLDPAAGGVSRYEEAARVNQLDREEPDQVVQHALLDALHGCPRPFPRRFFPWLQAVLVHRALDHIRHDLGEQSCQLPFDTSIKDVIDAVLADDSRPAASFFRAPASPAFQAWLSTLDLPAIFELSAEFATYARTRSACERAVERLPNRQRQVVQGYYYDAITQAELARQHGLSDSSIRNTHAGALRNLRRDDELFEVLEAVGKVRDEARRIEVQRNRAAA